MLSSIQLFETPWTIVHQAPLSMDFSRQEYWSGLPFPTPGGLPDPGIKPESPALAGGCFTTAPPGKPTELCVYTIYTYTYVYIHTHVYVHVYYKFSQFIYISMCVYIFSFADSFLLQVMTRY